MPPVYPSGNNTFIPSHEESNRLVVDYSRNPSKFALNRYIQLVPCDKTEGYYLQMTVEECMRILGDDLAHYSWADGADAPTGVDGDESFNWVPFRLLRRLFAARLGNMSISNASWPLVQQHNNIKAQQAMTARSVMAVKALTTAGNYSSAHTATTTVAGGGLWPNATTANLFIRKSINYAVKQILKATGAVVKAEDLNLVISPALAASMAESQEIADFVKGSPDALAYIKGDMGGPESNRRFGLPTHYAGVELVIEDAVKVTSKKGATLVQDFVMPADKPFIAARPGGLIGTYGTPSFSTGTLFVSKEDDLSVETKNDTDNRRTVTRVVDTAKMEVTAPTSGFLFTGATE